MNALTPRLRSLSPRPVRWALLAAAAVLALVAAAALTAGPGAGSRADKAAVTRAAAAGKPVGGPVAAAPVPPGAARAEVQSLPQPASVSAAGAASSAGGSTAGAAGTAPAEADGARIVRTGTVSLAVDKGRVPAAVAQLDDLVASVHGYAADSSSDEAGDSPSAELTYRVPVGSFHAVLQRIRQLRVQVLSIAESGKDVTAAYADTQAQIQSLQAARQRYLAILARARTIGETLTVQQRVDDVQGQIDRLEGQRRVLADQSDDATLTVSVQEKGAQHALVAPAPSGWHKAWHDATHGFTSGLQAIVGASGRALLLLLVAAALLLIGRGGWLVARRRFA